MSEPRKRKVKAWIKLKLFDNFGLFAKEHNSEFYNRGGFNYLVSNPQYIEGKIGVSKFNKDLIFWNTTGKEFGTYFPTFYFPKEWIEELKRRKP